MTREEAIRELENSIKVGLSPDIESRKMAIKALKQYGALQEIRAEIDSYCSDNRDRNDGLYIAMRIIDKHLPGTGEIYPDEFED